MTSIAIVGAGGSALAAAHTLLDANWQVTLFEKSRGVGGRIATRKRVGFIYDHGAQYIKPGSPTSVSLITKRFLAPDLIDIQKPVWTFNSSGQIREGYPQQNAEPKWSYRSGLNTLAQRMAEGLSIHQETQISALQQLADGWHLLAGDNDTQFGPFDKLLITIPAPQAARILQASPLHDDLQTTLLASLNRAHYHPLLSIALGYHPRPQERPYYALVNSDKAHPISWLAWEHEKSLERVPTNSGLLLAQMAPPYSKEHWQTSDETLISDVATQVSMLLDEPLTSPIFSDLQRWRYALPSEKADASELNQLALPSNLAFCGDGFVGGRVHLSLEHGIMVAEQLLKS